MKTIWENIIWYLKETYLDFKIVYNSYPNVLIIMFTAFLAALFL